MNVTIKSLVKDHWISVLKIYAEGISTGLATFETEIPNWEQWDKNHIPSCRIIACIKNKIVGFAVLSNVSTRDVYKGVAEVSIYVAQEFRKQNIGKIVLHQLILKSEKEGFWTLQAGIFSKNTASISLHKSCGFRTIGRREKIGQLHGVWHDNLLMERRSLKIHKK